MAILCSTRFTMLVFLVAFSSFYRGSYVSAYVLLNLLNELVKRDKMRGLPTFINRF